MKTHWKIIVSSIISDVSFLDNSTFKRVFNAIVDFHILKSFNVKFHQTKNQVVKEF